MAQEYQPRRFFRNAPNPLLRRYFAARNVLRDRGGRHVDDRPLDRFMRPQSLPRLHWNGTLLLVLAGISAERQMPMDALPDISDAQVIIHTAWYEPPNVIEGQVTYPIVTALLAAPSVKAVRAQTMFGDSYVLVLEGVAALGSQCLARRRVVIKLGEFSDYGLLLVG